jgi:hypothetical protein
MKSSVGFEVLTAVVMKSSVGFEVLTAVVIKSSVGFEVLTAVVMKSSLLRHIAPCNPSKVYNSPGDNRRQGELSICS